MSRSTVYKKVKELEEKGILRKVREEQIRGKMRRYYGVDPGEIRLDSVEEVRGALSLRIASVVPHELVPELVDLALEEIKESWGLLDKIFTKLRARLVRIGMLMSLQSFFRKLEEDKEFRERMEEKREEIPEKERTINYGSIKEKIIEDLSEDEALQKKLDITEEKVRSVVTDLKKLLKKSREAVESLEIKEKKKESQ